MLDAFYEAQLRRMVGEHGPNDADPTKALAGHLQAVQARLGEDQWTQHPNRALSDGAIEIRALVDRATSIAMELVLIDSGRAIMGLDLDEIAEVLSRD